MKRFLVKALIGSGVEHTWECDTLEEATSLARQIGTDGALLGDEWSGLEFIPPQRIASVHAIRNPELLCHRCGRAERLDDRPHCAACWEVVRCPECEDRERSDAEQHSGEYCAECETRLVCAHCHARKWDVEQDGQFCSNCLADVMCRFCKSHAMVGGTTACLGCRPALAAQAARERAAWHRSRVFRHMSSEGFDGVAKPVAPRRDEGDLLQLYVYDGKTYCVVCGDQISGPAYQKIEGKTCKCICIECAVASVFGATRGDTRADFRRRCLLGESRPPRVRPPWPSERLRVGFGMLAGLSGLELDPDDYDNLDGIDARELKRNV